jgi:hypothetical protein
MTTKLTGYVWEKGKGEREKVYVNSFTKIINDMVNGKVEDNAGNTAIVSVISNH